MAEILQIYSDLGDVCMLLAHKFLCVIDVLTKFFPQGDSTLELFHVPFHRSPFPLPDSICLSLELVDFIMRSLTMKDNY